MSPTDTHDTPPRMARAEWPLMRICWQLGHATIPEIFLVSTRLRSSTATKRRTFDYKAVQILLHRLAAKGFLRIERGGRHNHHIPLVDHHESLRAETERFIEEVVGTGKEEIDLVIACLERAREER